MLEVEKNTLKFALEEFQKQNGRAMRSNSAKRFTDVVVVFTSQKPFLFIIPKRKEKLSFRMPNTIVVKIVTERKRKGMTKCRHHTGFRCGLCPSSDERRSTRSRPPIPGKLWQAPGPRRHSSEPTGIS